MVTATQLLLVFGGLFFLTGLLCGVWKYLAIARSPEARAPVYVDIAHRAALMYAFSTLVVQRFVDASRLSHTVELIAVLVQVVFFALALTSYLIHGWLRDTDNQLARPHRIGRGQLPPALMVGFMVSLILAEVGGFAVLLWGALVTAPTLG